MLKENHKSLNLTNIARNVEERTEVVPTVVAAFFSSGFLQANRYPS